MPSHTPDPSLAGPLYGRDPWPLRFHSHSFDAICFNTLACSIVYDRRQFGTQKLDQRGEPYDDISGEPPFGAWRQRWTGHHSVTPANGRTFPSDVEIKWKSLSGNWHAATLDLDKIFRRRLVLHDVAREDVKEAWLDAKSVHPVSPGILVEVNDRTINVFMRALVVTEVEQEPGNANSHFRDDLMLAWTHHD